MLTCVSLCRGCPHLCLCGLFHQNVAMTMQSPCSISVNSLIIIFSHSHALVPVLLSLGGTNTEKVQSQTREKKEMVTEFVLPLFI